MCRGGDGKSRCICFKLLLLAPLPLPTHPPPPPSTHSVAHWPTHVLWPSCYRFLPHAFCPYLAVTLTFQYHWHHLWIGPKTKRASLIPLNQHKIDNPFLFRCNHVALLINSSVTLLIPVTRSLFPQSLPHPSPYSPSPPLHPLSSASLPSAMSRWLSTWSEMLYYACGQWHWHYSRQNLFRRPPWWDTAFQKQRFWRNPLKWRWWISDKVSWQYPCLYPILLFLALSSRSRVTWLKNGTFPRPSVMLSQSCGFWSRPQSINSPQSNVLVL